MVAVGTRVTPAGAVAMTGSAVVTPGATVAPLRGATVVGCGGGDWDWHAASKPSSASVPTRIKRERLHNLGLLGSNCTGHNKRLV